MRNWKGSLGVAVLVALVAPGCGGNGRGGGESVAPVGSPSIDGGRTVEKTIGAAGGSITLADGAVLVIPPGALDVDTKIRGTVPTDQTAAGKLHEYAFGPVGTRFKIAASLTLPYADTEDRTPPAITIYQSSTLNPTVDFTTETSNWNHPRVLARDYAARTVTVALEHFTIVYVSIDEELYLIDAVPRKYLAACDLEFWLTAPSSFDHVLEVKQGIPAGPSWNPGHAALHIGDKLSFQGAAPDSRIQMTVAGVERQNGDHMRDPTGHIYMGPRRVYQKTAMGDYPVGSPEREKIVRWANSMVQEPGMGAGYLPEGESAETLGMTSGGFIRDAFKKGGIELPGNFLDGKASPTLALWHATAPVDRIVMNVGETIDMPIYAVMIDPNSPVFERTYQGWYTKDEHYSVKEMSQPPTAQLIRSADPADSSCVFHWTPQPEDGNKTFDCEWGVFATVLGRPLHERRKLTIYVNPCPPILTPPCPPPATTPCPPVTPK